LKIGELHVDLMIYGQSSIPYFNFYHNICLAHHYYHCAQNSIPVAQHHAHKAKEGSHKSQIGDPMLPKAANL